MLPWEMAKPLVMVGTFQPILVWLQSNTVVEEKPILLAISKYFGNRKLKAVLIQGAFAYITKLKKRPVKTKKDKWLVALLERAGTMRTAVALANKNARTAWALLTQNSDYDTSHELAMAA